MSMVEKKSWSRWVVFLLVLFNALQAKARQMEVQARRTNFEEAFKVLPGHMPRWSHGFLVSWKFDTLPSDTGANVSLYDQNAKLVGKTRIWVDGASFLRIDDAAATKDGRLAVVGWATTSSGTFAGFFADASITQGSGRIVQTAPFNGHAVAFAPDGTIWVFGVVRGPGDGAEPAPDYYMVQHFGSDDVLKEQHLLRSDFPCELGAFGMPQVVASADRIGLFSPSCMTYVELSFTGNLLGNWRWSPISPMHNVHEIAGMKYGIEEKMMRSVALTPSNELYGVRNAPGNERLFRFDRNSSQWLPVKTDAGFSLLLGNDGESIVTLIAAYKELTWFKPVI